MAFFCGLLFFYGLAWIIDWFSGSALMGAHAFKGIFALSCMFVLVGISHFAKPQKIEAMLPARWPYKRAMNYVSGLAEIVLGVLLLFPATRWLAACGLILLLLAVFPANVHVARQKPSLYTVSRLFFQPVYIAWVCYFCFYA